MTRVIIIDDHVVVRAGLKYVLASDPELQLVGEFGGGQGAAQFVADTGCDVVLLDVRMPDMSGVEVLKEILAIDPKQKVVMLTTSNLEEDVYRAIEAGAMGYVMKESTVEEIITAIRAVRYSNHYMSDEVRQIYETRKGAKGLAPRETEVLTLVAKGLSNRDIAGILGISENSVKMYLKRAFFKLGAADRTDAVNLALKRGFISL